MASSDSSRRNSNNSCSTSSNCCSEESSVGNSDDSNTSQVNCIICLESYKAMDNICGGKCGHVFHLKCIKRWMENSEQCPICRSTNSEYFPIYLNFEEPSQCQNQCQSSDYENMLYEAALYRDEIKYLNDRIKSLTLKNNPYTGSSDDSDYINV